MFSEFINFMSIQTVIPGAFRKIEETDLFIFLIFHERVGL